MSDKQRMIRARAALRIRQVRKAVARAEYLQCHKQAATADGRLGHHDEQVDAFVESWNRKTLSNIVIDPVLVQAGVEHLDQLCQARDELEQAVNERHKALVASRDALARSRVNERVFENFSSKLDADYYQRLVRRSGTDND